MNAMTIAYPERTKLELADILARHQSRVYSIACRILQDPATAEEVAQDVFLALHRNLDTIASEEHLQHWLRRVTVQRATDAHRRRAVRTDFGAAELEEEMLVAPGGTDPLPQFEAEGSVGRLLQGLPALQRTIVVLRYQEDMTPTEIAETLSMPVNTVKSHLQRSLKQMRIRLENQRKEVRHD